MKECTRAERAWEQLDGSWPKPFKKKKKYQNLSHESKEEVFTLSLSNFLGPRSGCRRQGEQEEGDNTTNFEDLTVAPGPARA